MATATITRTEQKGFLRYPIKPVASPAAIHLPSPPHSPADPPSVASFASLPQRQTLASPPPPSSYYTVPPPGALVFHQHVHRPPKPLSKSEQWRLSYSGNTAFVTLEVWESWLIHLLLLSLLIVSTIFLSRLFSPTSLLSLASRLKYYVVGPSSAAASEAVGAAAAAEGASSSALAMRGAAGWAARNASAPAAAMARAKAGVWNFGGSLEL
ncbi:hypothetical protein JCM11251_007997 [Rhodosporidiobolus azoricus]